MVSVRMMLPAAALCVAGCSSGSDGSNEAGDPLAGVLAQQAFTAAGNSVSHDDALTTVTAGTTPVTMAFGNSTNDVVVTVDGVDYPISVSNAGDGTGGSASVFVGVDRISNASHTAIYEVRTLENDQITRILFPLGTATDAATLAEQSGTASYVGKSHLTIAGADLDEVVFGEGASLVTVDFDVNSADVTLDHVLQNDGQERFGALTFEGTDLPLADGTYQGVLVVTADELGIDGLTLTAERLLAPSAVSS